MRVTMIDPKRILKAAAAAAGCVFLIIYVYRQVIGVSSEKLETENAFAVSYEKTVSGTGYILRSERVLDPVQRGAVFPAVKDGEKVSAGSLVANVYKSEADAGSVARLNEIDEKLSILESSIVDQEFFSADVAKLEQDKNEILRSILKSKTENDYAACIQRKKQLLISMNKLSSVKTGTSFSDEIAALTDERSKIASARGAVYGGIFAPVSGHYTGVTDGYEKIFLPELLPEMTISEFEQMIAREPDSTLAAANAGKLITDSRWYLCCELQKSETVPFSVGTVYAVQFPYAADLSLKMELYRVISETDRNEVVLIFTTDEMPQDFSYARMQKIEIVSESYTGLRVPKAAMRKLHDELDGVYILVGETVRFRRVEVIYEIDDYYIVRSESEAEKEKNAADSGSAAGNGGSAAGDGGSTAGDSGSEVPAPPESAADAGASTDADAAENYRYISLYDNVIVRGKDLYDGKSIS